jgi:hypothetical protein
MAKLQFTRPTPNAALARLSSPRLEDKGYHARRDSRVVSARFQNFPSHD